MPSIQNCAKNVTKIPSTKLIDKNYFFGLKIFTQKKIVKGPRDDTKEDNSLVQWDVSLCERKKLKRKNFTIKNKSNSLKMPLHTKKGIASFFFCHFINMILKDPRGVSHETRSILYRNKKKLIARRVFSICRRCRQAFKKFHEKFWLMKFFFFCVKDILKFSAYARNSMEMEHNNRNCHQVLKV